jgi:hypothetical protein
MLSRLLLERFESSEDLDYYIRWFKAVQASPVLREATTRKLQERIEELDEMVNTLNEGRPRPVPCKIGRYA